MANNESPSHAEEEHGRHASSARYLWSWVALLVLTAVTYWLSRFHFGGGWAITVALVIASAKGAVVALFFMHLWDQRGANRLVFITSLVFVALLIGLTVADNATRFSLSNPPGAESNAWPEPSRGALAPPGR